MNSRASDPNCRSLMWSFTGALVAAALSTVVLAVPGESGFPGRTGTVYDASRWVLVVGALAAAVALLARGDRRLPQLAAGVGIIAALQLMTTGMVALKHWRPFSGMTGFGHANLEVVLALAAVLTVAGAVASVSFWRALRASDSFSEHALSRSRALTVATAAVLAIGLPVVLGVGSAETTDLTSLGAYALLYSLPWAAGLGASSWLVRPAALAVHGAVAGSALVCLVSHDVVQVTNPVVGFLSVAALTALSSVSLVIRRPATAASSTAVTG